MKRIKFLITFFVLLSFSINLSAQKFQKLALTPPMGWNSWNKFHCQINEKIIREMADAMVESGMKDAGYQYIIIDDCWHGERDSLGYITASKEHFPSGIKDLADYIHSKGLKFGIYSCAGYQTCAGKPASRGYEFQDAYMYAKWGVDYLKYDWCNTPKINAESAYTTMRDAIHKAGRPMIFSLCEWGQNQPWLWAKEVGHLWRTTGDITNCFDCIDEHNGAYTTYGVLQILDKQNELRRYSGKDHWNDPDMLEVGNGMPQNESRAHFTMWCMLAAPLIAGNDLPSMTTETKGILMNKELIDIDQDSLGIQGFRYESKDSLETWLKPLAKGEWAYCVLNRSNRNQVILIDWNKTNITDSLSNLTLNPTGKNVYKIKNLWLKKDIGDTRKPTKSVVSSHDIVCLKLFK